MGYTTDFTGSVAVDPPLNPSEIDYLTRFADSRRFTRVAGPYALEELSSRGPDVIDYNQPPQGQPSLWCDWAPTADGTAIEWNETEKFYDSAEWMQFLIDTFLRSGASLRAELAQPVSGRLYDEAFASFTFDHTVNGTINAQGEDPDDTWRLVVTDNVVGRIDADAESDGDDGVPRHQGGGSVTTTPLYTAETLAWFREQFADTEFLVHVIGPDDVLLYSDARDGFDPGGEREGTVPFTLATADEAAKNINAVHARIEATDPSPFNPFLHATVFHHGKPLAAPGDVLAAPAFDADELAWFKETWGDTEWVAYVHGMDECFDRRNDGDPPFTEETIRKYVADMALWDREHVAQGLSASPVSVFHYGVLAEAEGVAK